MTMTRTKAALIRRPGYPIGEPAPCFLRCCGNELDIPDDGSETVTCPTCGEQFDSSGNVTSRLLHEE